MGIHLIIDYYEDARSDRREELLTSLRRNLSHPVVEAVYNLGSADDRPPEDVVADPKYVSYPHDHRLTFADAFAFANERLNGCVVGLCNLDIHLDPAANWAEAEKLVRGGQIVMCQSRTELNPDGSTYLDPTFARLAHANAQDAWFWLAPLEVPNCTFELGTLGSDNAIADRIRKADRVPVNLASRFKVIHLDICRGKHGANTNQLHKQETESRNSIYSRFPERDGCYLLPDFDRIDSIDRLAACLGMTPIAKYQVICDLMSRMISIKN